MPVVKIFSRFEIKNIYYHHAREDAIKLASMNTTQDVMLIDTAYKGQVTSVDPKSSNVDTDIVILMWPSTNRHFY